jgi:hypothetical protein
VCLQPDGVTTTVKGFLKSNFNYEYDRLYIAVIVLLAYLGIFWCVPLASWQQRSCLYLVHALVHRCIQEVVLSPEAASPEVRDLSAVMTHLYVQVCYAGWRPQQH